PGVAWHAEDRPRALEPTRRLARSRADRPRCRALALRAWAEGAPGAILDLCGHPRGLDAFHSVHATSRRPRRLRGPGGLRVRVPRPLGGLGRQARFTAALRRARGRSPLRPRAAAARARCPRPASVPARPARARR